MYFISQEQLRCRSHINATKIIHGWKNLMLFHAENYGEFTSLIYQPRILVFLAIEEDFSGTHMYVFCVICYVKRKWMTRRLTTSSHVAENKQRVKRECGTPNLIPTVISWLFPATQRTHMEGTARSGIHIYDSTSLLQNNKANVENLIYI